MHNKDMKEECNRGDKDLRDATKIFQEEKNSSWKKLKKDLYQIKKERIKWMYHWEELIMKL